MVRVLFNLYLIFLFYFISLDLASNLNEEFKKTKGIDDIDKENFLWFIKFFTGYHYYSQLKCVEEEESKFGKNNNGIHVSPNLVAATLDIDTFKFVASCCRLFQIEKNWDDLSLAVGAFKEMVKYIKLTKY